MDAGFAVVTESSVPRRHVHSVTRKTMRFDARGSRWWAFSGPASGAGALLPGAGRPSGSAPAWSGVRADGARRNYDQGAGRALRRQQRSHSQRTTPGQRRLLRQRPAPGKLAAVPPAVRYSMPASVASRPHMRSREANFARLASTRKHTARSGAPFHRPAQTTRMPAWWRRRGASSASS